MKRISNKYISGILYEIADILEMDEKPETFKIRAYRRAAREIENHPKTISKILDTKKLIDIPGIGEGIANKVKEISESGTCNFYEQLKRKIPVDIESLNRIEGMGPKKIKVLYEKLGIKSIRDLEKAAKRGKISKLPGFREKTEKNILKGIKSYRKHSSRFRLDEAMDYADLVTSAMKEHSATRKLEVAGSLKRRKETIGDLDVLIVSDDVEASMEYFTKLDNVTRILGKGKKKATIEFDNGLQADLRVIEERSWGSAMQYFVGDQAHNIKVRKIAIKKGYKLNEYGLFDKKGKQIAGSNEEGIYKKLGMGVPPYEIRRDCGEVEAAKRGKLPNLIKRDDIKGDLHMHSNLSDGQNSPREMAVQAGKMGYDFIALTEHNNKGLEIAGGIDEKDIPSYVKKVRKIKSKVKILAGLEVNIAKDGTLTVRDRYLKLLDFIVIGIHSHFRMDSTNMTKRILKAIGNPYVNVFAHPTGRLLFKRDAYEYDFEAVCKEAAKQDVCMEINAYPDRLDLDGEHVQLAKSYGCKFSIGTDSHSTSQMRYAKYGVYMARRGWLEKRDLINAKDIKSLKRYLLEKRKKHA